MSKKTVKVILMFVGILILIASYLFIFMDYTTKTDALNVEISDLDTKLNTLSGYEAGLPRFTETIAQDRTAVGDMLSKYRSVERPEDFIMLATALEDNVGLSVTGLTFEAPAAIWAATGVTDGKDVNAPVTQMPLVCYKTGSAISGEMNYEQVKQALDYISKQPGVMRLNSLNLTYDSSTGFIKGELSLEKYYITGLDIPEQETKIPAMDIGKNVLIGS